MSSKIVDLIFILLIATLALAINGSLDLELGKVNEYLFQVCSGQREIKDDPSSLERHKPVKCLRQTNI
jgi:hypothetical protein